MFKFKRYFVILLLTVFVFGSMAATAMAYCGSGYDASSTEMSLDTSAHHRMDMAAMDHSSEASNTAPGHHNSTDESNSSCFDCYGSLCHSQSLVSLHLALDLDTYIVALQVEEEINLKFIFLTSIPQPPKLFS